MRLTRTCLQWEVLLHITDVPDIGTITTLLDPELKPTAKVMHFIDWLDNPDVLRLIDLENMKLKKPRCSRLKLLACGPEGNQEALPHKFGDYTALENQDERTVLFAWSLSEMRTCQFDKGRKTINVIPLQLPYSAFGSCP